VAGNGEVRVEKVDKIRYVYNAVTRPSVPATVTKKLAAANVAISRKNSGTTLVRGVASPRRRTSMSTSLRRRGSLS
jgi:hypothetical protein